MTCKFHIQVCIIEPIDGVTLLLQNGMRTPKQTSLNFGPIGIKLSRAVIQRFTALVSYQYHELCISTVRDQGRRGREVGHIPSPPLNRMKTVCTSLELYVHGKLFLFCKIYVTLNCASHNVKIYTDCNID